MKYGGMSITALIGLVVESQVIDAVDYLAEHRSDAVSKLIADLSVYEYADASSTYERMIKSEYQAFKQVVEGLPHTYRDAYYGYTIFDAVWSE